MARKKTSKDDSKYFIKTDIAILDDLASLAVVYPSASALLAVLKALIANDRNTYGGVMVSGAILMELTRTSKPTLFKSVKILTEGGFMGVARCGRNNVYILNPDICTMTAPKHNTYTLMDSIRIVMDDRESRDVKLAIQRMKNLKSKQFKQIRGEKQLTNDKDVKVSRTMKYDEKSYLRDNIDKETGEVLK